jgi:hypothetical protein
MSVSVLVVAHATATSPELVEALKARAEQGSVQFTLLLPCKGAGMAARDEAGASLEEALALYRDEGIEAEGVVGDGDPLVAVHEIWDPKRFDEIIVSTLPGHASEWLRSDLPHRIARLTDAQVRHVLSTTPQAPLNWEPAPRRERSPLGPLSVLAWGHPRDETPEERERRLRALRR